MIDAADEAGKGFMTSRRLPDLSFDEINDLQ
jgi:hypothetical protein